MATDVIGSALHPLQGCGWSSISAQCILKIQTLHHLGTETVSMKYLAQVCQCNYLWSQFLLSFWDLFESLKL